MPLALASRPGSRKCFLMTKAAHQASASCFLWRYSSVCSWRRKASSLARMSSGRSSGSSSSAAAACCRRAWVSASCWAKSGPRSLALGLVALLQHRAGLLVVALDGGEGLVGQAGGDQFGRGAEQAVADADVVVEEGERLAGFQRFEPQAHAAQLGGHRVDVHAVEAAADHVAQGVLVEERRGFALALRQRAHAGQVPGQPVRRADEEVAGADGRVADLEGEDGLLGLGAGLALDRLLHHRVEGGVEQALHQRVGRVVGAGGLALVAGELGEGEAGAVGADLRGQREQALVDAAQFLGAEVLVVHGAQHLALAGEGEVAQGFEEVVVGQLGVVERGGGGRVPEEAAERRQGQVLARGGEGGVAGERADEKLELPPQVAVAAALDLATASSRRRAVL